MSWSIHIDTTTPNTAATDLLQTVQDTPDSHLQEGAAREQAARAAAFAATILQDPSVLSGNDSSTFGATLSGHKQFGAGSSRDALTINLFRTSDAATADDPIPGIHTDSEQGNAAATSEPTASA